MSASLPHIPLPISHLPPKDMTDFLLNYLFTTRAYESFQHFLLFLAALVVKVGMIGFMVYMSWAVILFWACVVTRGTKAMRNVVASLLGGELRMLFGAG